MHSLKGLTLLTAFAMVIPYNAFASLTYSTTLSSDKRHTTFTATETNTDGPLKKLFQDLNLATVSNVSGDTKSFELSTGQLKIICHSAMSPQNKTDCVIDLYAGREVIDQENWTEGEIYVFGNNASVSTLLVTGNASIQELKGLLPVAGDGSYAIRLSDKALITMTNIGTPATYFGISSNQ